jgi:hypothetical protein
LTPSLQGAALGRIDSSLDTVGVWLRPEGDESDQEPENPTYHGVVYYMQPGTDQVVGVLLWNVEDVEQKIHNAKSLLRGRIAYPEARHDELKRQVPL